jgi:CheY-like chemotaxis protein
VTHADASRLLVIDDDDGITEALTDVLMDAGYQVETACNGEAALRRLEAPPAVDAIMLDLTMPIMDGFEFRRRVLQDDRLSRIPVIVMSAGLRSEVWATLQAAAYLRKTTPVPELLATIAKVLASR